MRLNWTAAYLHLKCHSSFACVFTSWLSHVQKHISSIAACSGNVLSDNVAITLQGQIKEMALCLRNVGTDVDYHPSGSRVEQLLNEYCCSNFVKARADPLGHKALMAKVQYTPDHLAVAVSNTKLCPLHLCAIADLAIAVSRRLAFKSAVRLHRREPGFSVITAWIRGEHTI